MEIVMLTIYYGDTEGVLEVHIISIFRCTWTILWMLEWLSDQTTLSIKGTSIMRAFISQAAPQSVVHLDVMRWRKVKVSSCWESNSGESGLSTNVSWLSSRTVFPPVSQRSSMHKIVCGWIDWDLGTLSSLPKLNPCQVFCCISSFSVSGSFKAGCSPPLGDS